jgi:glycine/D-amino acid oxidase-like deaminating enzyme
MTDVFIVGAGIVGCALARECAQAGLSVAILEREEPSVIAGGTTAAGMGHVVVMDDSPAQLALTAYSRSLWSGLQPQLPSNVEYEARGTLWVAADEEELAAVHAKHALYRSTGIRSEILDAHALAAAEPNLRPGLAGALLVPDDAVLYPPTAAAFFLQQALAAGATLLRGTAIGAAKGCVQLRDGTRHAAAHIVLATGTSVSLAPGVVVEPRKGHLLITDRYPDFVRHQLVELGYLRSAHQLTADSAAFNVQPRRNGQILIGSSRQYGNSDSAIDHAILTRMLDRACSYMPGLAALSGIRAWTGFRAATPDKLPLLGPTEDPTISLALGLEGLGITNAPAAARLLADQLLRRTSAIDPIPYLPARLASPVVSKLSEAAHA